MAYHKWGRWRDLVWYQKQTHSRYGLAYGSFAKADILSSYSRADLQRKLVGWCARYPRQVLRGPPVRGRCRLERAKFSQELYLERDHLLDSSRYLHLGRGVLGQGSRVEPDRSEGKNLPWTSWYSKAKQSCGQVHPCPPWLSAWTKRVKPTTIWQLRRSGKVLPSA